MLERPGVDPDDAFVEGDLAVAHRQQVGAETGAGAMQHRLQRVAAFVAFGVGPEHGRDAAAVDMAAAEGGDEAQHVEHPLGRLASEAKRLAVALDREAAETAHAQGPRPLRDAAVGTGQRAQRDHLACICGVGVEVDRGGAEPGGQARQGAKEMRQVDAARLGKAGDQLGARFVVRAFVKMAQRVRQVHMAEAGCRLRAL